MKISAGNNNNKKSLNKAKKWKIFIVKHRPIKTLQLFDYLREIKKVNHKTFEVTKYQKC
jgi:hypothetical protein